MNILFDIGHPGHVHLLRNSYFKLIEDGHKVWVTTKNIKIIKELLDYYKIPYIPLGKKADSIIGKQLNQFKYNFLIWKLVLTNKITLGVGSSITIAHVSRITKMQSIVLDDDDDNIEPLFVKYAHPFADVVLTPSAIKKDRKTPNAIFYNGYHELAYLHPNRFQPNSEITKNIGLDEGEHFFIMRFNAFKAHHDVGVIGLSLEQKLELVHLLEQYGKVFITTEREPEPELKKYHMPVSPEKIHDLMACATMFLGDSQTMTSEAAILGIPALKCNTFAGKLAVPNELEDRYGLCYSYLPENFDKFYNHIKSILENNDPKDEWKKKREILLKDKIDVSSFITWFIENYPESKRIMMENQEYQMRFK
ncbi:MAG: DUF354 domain-containing protein [Paludibacteraceae bacterium]|nr:DUF354 domain-containing protein [Paludibacteraceae bacterium]